MNMHWIDWSVVVAVIVMMLFIARVTARHTRSVADFLAANRLAGRYLLTTASGMAGLGAISIAAHFEKFYQAGFGAAWWSQMLGPVGLILALSGFVIYRYRETRCMTMAEFFERRYSRRFRLFCGGLAFVSGVLNYGVFPGVTARFIIYFTGIPASFDMLGVSVPTVAPVMLAMLTIAAFLALSGGQIAVMITDFVQGQFVNITMLVVMVFFFSYMSWSDVVSGLQQAPPDRSLLNPFSQSAVPDFNVFFFLITAFMQVYGFKAWQGAQGYNAAARSPHEARMAGVLAEFRGMITVLLILLPPLFIYAILHLPQYAAEQAQVAAVLEQIDSPQVREQVRVPVGLSLILPVGVMGMFAAIVICAAVATDDTYLHSWGSIFIQDVVVPLRKTPLSGSQHLRLLRAAVVGVAIFAFAFSMLFPLNDYIFMYFQITGAIYLGGAGAVILGGLYWKRGAVEGAWAAMLLGSTVAVGGIALRNIVWPYLLPGWRENHPDWQLWSWLPEQFPLNGTQMAFVAALVAIVGYVVGSLLSRRPPADMQRLLHRGPYAIETEGHRPRSPLTASPTMLTFRQRLERRVGIGPDFTTGDKAIYWLKIAWTTFMFGSFLIGTILASFVRISDAMWVRWWSLYVAIFCVAGVLTVIWFLVGGIGDLVQFMRDIRGIRRDETDDGSVREVPEVEEVACK